MPTLPRALTLVVCTLVAALSLDLRPAAAQQALKEGTDYRKLDPPQPTGSPGKIEVIEFFSYGCPHCAHFYPILEAWRAKLPKDVVFVRVPVGFNNDAWIDLQRAYYALQASGDLQKLDAALFHALHEEKLKLYDEESLADWVGKNGGNAGKFSSAYTSFGVNNQTVQADEMAEKFRIDSVPSMAVNGEYVAMANAENGELPYLNELLANTDRLIALVRAAQAAPGAAVKPR